jgi:hypothetical protein
VLLISWLSAVAVAVAEMLVPQVLVEEQTYRSTFRLILGRLSSKLLAQVEVVDLIQQTEMLALQRR